MGYTTSAVHGIEVPNSAEANDVPEDIGKVVTALEGGSIVRRLTGAAIAALSGAQKTAGVVVYNTTTGKLQISNGSAFVDADATAVAAQATATAALPKAGGTMSGNIAMGGSKVTGLGAASVNGDAVRYEQLTALGEWAAWTPSLTASGSNPTASNVTAESRYTQIGKTVMGVGYMDVTAAGSGTYRVSLPVAPRSSSSNGFQIGRARMIYTDGSAYAYDMVLLKAASQSYCVMATHDYATETTSYCDNQNWSELRTHGSSNVYLVWHFTYEAA